MLAYAHSLCKCKYLLSSAGEEGCASNNRENHLPKGTGRRGEGNIEIRSPIDSVVWILKCLHGLAC